MNLRQRTKAAWGVLRGKSAVSEWTELNNLFKFLGIDPDKTGDATSEATYYACLKVLTEAIGKLPLKIQQYTENGGIRIAREHPYYRMLNERPNRYMTASSFWGTCEQFRDDRGNSYAWIDTRDPKRPQLWHLNPDNVQVYYDDARKLSDVVDVYYRYTVGKDSVVFSSEEIIHLKSHYTKNGITGISVREQLSATLRGNIKAQEFINKTIESGMTAKSVLNYTGSLNDANVQALVKEVTRYAKGEMKDKGIENIIPMPVGFSLTPLNLKLADSQFLELRQYSALQIASAFGVKPYQVGDYTKSSYASAEAQQLSFLIDTLLFIVKQYEEELTYKLLTDAEVAAGYHIKFNVAVILRADQKTQIETLRSAVSGFLMTPNEARERLDLPAKEGGDQLIGNGSTIPITEVGVQWQQQTATEEPEEEDEQPEEEEPQEEETPAEDDTPTEEAESE
jgi:HK97 family phage portal protein